MKIRRLTVALLFAAVLPPAVAPMRARAGEAGARTIWRLGARLATADGRAFWVSADFFRYAEPRHIVLDPAEISIVDERTLRHYTDRRVERELATAGPSSPTSVHAGNWSLARARTGDGSTAFDVVARAGATTLHLRQTARKRPVIYDFGNGAHETYSALDCAGTIDLAGTTYSVTGKGWLDRANGTDAVAPREGVRDSFVLQLDDRREVIVVSAGPSARRAVPQAFLVHADGSVEQLAHDRYFFVGHNVWHSTHTPTDYPDQWGLAVFGETPNLLFEPAVLDQESPAHGMGANFYESAFDVFDNTPGSTGARLGSAFGLLSGYDNPGAMR